MLAPKSLAFATLFFVSQLAHAQTPDACGAISDLITDARAQPPAEADDQAWQTFEDSAQFAYAQMAVTGYRLYLSSGVRPSQLYACMTPQESARLRYQMAFAFLELSLSDILSWGRPRGFAFAAEIGRRFGEGAIASFGLGTGPIDERPALRIAGFHRGYRGLYLNPEELAADQWFLIYFHEFAHALDDQLAHAVAEAKTDVFARKASKIATDPDVDAWIANGLERGLLAEYRAWVVTASLYVEQRAASRIAKTRWFEDFIGEDREPNKIRLRIFRRLDAGFTDPTTSPYDTLRFASRLAKQRAEIRIRAEQGDLPTLGNLSDYAEPVHEPVHEPGH